MKIGILTHPLEINYGAILQNYALQQVLKKAGHEVLTIDRHNDDITERFLKCRYYYALRAFVKSVVKMKWMRACLPFSQKQVYRISPEIQEFIKNKISLTDRITSNSNLQESNKYGFDLVIVGSDQIWISSYAPNSYLKYVTDKKTIKIAYSASFGSSRWNYSPELTAECKELVKYFKAISVRELSGVRLCKDYLGCEAKCVLDPSLLLNATDYNLLLNLDKFKFSNRKYIAAYIINETLIKKETIDYLTSKNNLEVDYFTLPKFINKHTKLKSIEHWLCAIKDSELVVTDSFHGTAYAIIFNKQFITVASNDNGIDRFNSLLFQFNLEDRLITEFSENKINDILAKKIDYNLVNDIVCKKRKYSLKFLLNAINN